MATSLDAFKTISSNCSCVTFLSIIDHIWENLYFTLPHTDS